jgi:hypothetical protein
MPLAGRAQDLTLKFFNIFDTVDHTNSDFHVRWTFADPTPSLKSSRTYLPTGSQIKLIETRFFHLFPSVAMQPLFLNHAMGQSFMQVKSVRHFNVFAIQTLSREGSFPIAQFEKY